jgi:hypothetical protein
MTKTIGRADPEADPRQEDLTQEELAQELKAQGIAATQVTLSRDIRDLRLVKTRDGYQEWRRRSRAAVFAAGGRVPEGRAARAEPGGAQDLARPRQFGGGGAR